jgi:hypothetical protein
MRRPILLFAWIAVLVPAGASAQGNLRWGLGLGLQQASVFPEDEIGLLSAVAPTVYVPIVLPGGMMVEPGLGLFRVREEDSEFDETATYTAVRASVAVLFALATPERGRFYVGPRVGVLRLTSVFEAEGDDGEVKRNDLFVAAIAGGEGFVTPALSLGGEASLNYYSLGETEYDPDPGFEDDDDMSTLSLGAEFRVRWYIR